MRVSLTFPEVMMAGHAALMRNVSNIFHGRKHRFGQSRYNWNDHIEGGCAEFAYAKATGQFWSGSIGDFSAADVGSVEIRHSVRDDARLILHDDDADDATFVLVTGSVPHFDIRGSIKGIVGKDKQWWCDPTGNNRPAYFVPQSELTPWAAESTAAAE